MADVAKLEFNQINSYTHGTDTIVGVTGLSIQLRRGPLKFTRADETEELPTVKDRDPLEGAAPLTITPTGRSTAFATTLIAAASAAVTAVARLAGGTLYDIDIPGVEYDSGPINLNQSPGGSTSSGATGYAVSADGAALPITIAASV